MAGNTHRSAAAFDSPVANRRTALGWRVGEIVLLLVGGADALDLLRIFDEGEPPFEDPIRDPQAHVRVAFDPAGPVLLLGVACPDVERVVQGGAPDRDRVGDEVGRRDLDRDFALGVAETPVGWKVLDLASETQPGPSILGRETSDEAEAKCDCDQEVTGCDHRDLPCRILQ